MTKHNQRVEDRPDPIGKRGAKPMAIVSDRSVSNPLSSLGPLPVPNKGTSFLPAMPFPDVRMQANQRQALATQIGQQQGNFNLMRIVHSLKRTKDRVSVQLSSNVVEGEQILNEAGLPPGVHDARTAIAYAQVRRSPQLFELLYGQMSAPNLVAEAERLNSFLLGPCARLGDEAQSEVALLLIDLESEMHRRLREADREGFLPIVEGITWDPDDPLAGITEAISPFGMLDVWTTFVLETSAERSRAERRRQPDAPTSTITYSLPGTPNYLPVSSQINVTIGNFVWVGAEGSNDPAGGVLTYQWQLYCHPQQIARTSRATLTNTHPAHGWFIPDIPGRYVVMLTVVSNRSGLSDTVMASFNAEVQRSEQPRQPETSPPEGGEQEDTPSWDRGECAEGEIAGVPGLVSGGRYFYGLHTTEEGGICHGRYDCGTDHCEGLVLPGNEVHRVQYFEGVSDQQNSRVSRERYGGIDLDSRTYKAGVDAERRRQGGGPVRYGRP